MFTGIIQAIGRVAAVEPKGGDVRLSIETGMFPLSDVAVGDSIAVSGVCLTAVELGVDRFLADLSRETLARTTLADARIGTPVNLELALTPTTRLGGHIVSGHVDGVGVVLGRQEDARSVRFQIRGPDALAKYIAEKGSVCVDGISLTVNRVNGAAFDVNIVPHTLAETTLGTTRTGGKVNLEVDILARYLERLMLGEQAAVAESGVTKDLLRQSGFISE
jgi:riboflavin synthase